LYAPVPDVIRIKEVHPSLVGWELNLELIDSVKN